MKRGEVIVEGDRTTIIFQRTIQHSIDRVWEAITNPEDLSAWLVQSARVDARVGGRIEYVSTPTPFVWTGQILVWDPPRVFEHELNVDPQPQLAPHLLSAERTIARWELTAQGASTLLTLSYRGFSKPTATGFAPGTHAFLERLDAHLQGAPLPEWTQRFEELRAEYPAWGPG